MRKPESILSIFLGNLFFIGFCISVLVGYWAQHMYAVGMDVDLHRVIPATIILVLAASICGTWVTWKVTRGKF